MKAKLLFLFIIMMISQSEAKPQQISLQVEKGGTYNTDLKFVHAPEGWTGNKLNEKKQFINMDSVRMPALRDVLKWKAGKHPQKEEKKRDPFSINVVKDTSFLHTKEDVLVWLGHSCFFIRINSVTIITDPVFNDILMVKRHHSSPFDPSLITQVDYILVSHNHRDHCDKKSLQLLSEKNPKATVLTGLGMGKLMSKWIPNSVQEAGWFQQFQTERSLSIVFLPAQHWSKRGISDTNKTLWGSYSINIGSKKLYFSGDTGWGSHFEYIGKNFGPFDICFLPIGAYSPRWFMKASHIDPAQAAEGFSLLNGNRFIPIHYATFDLSDEPMGEPLTLIREDFKKRNEENHLVCPAVGEVLKGF